MKARALRFVAAALLAASCGEAPPPARDPAAVAAPKRPAIDAPSSAGPGGGSSDGVTCEEARDKNVEEVSVGQKGQADLTAADLGPVINNGTYLNECEVPSDTKVSVCVAVKDGAAVGVTVSMQPPNPDLETCVAKRVRALSFPSHPKMDIVRTQF